MTEDPQDMFRDMDEMFTYLYAQMTRDFPGREPRVFCYPTIIDSDGESAREPYSSYEDMGSGSEPIVEVHCIDEEVKVITELPGATRDVLHLAVKGDKLFIDADTGTTQYHTSANLPPVNPDPVQVSLKNGVLEVTFAVSSGIPDDNEW